MDYNYEAFSNILPLLKDFQYHFISYREILKVMPNLPGEREFWVYTCDAHLKMASASWCMVFGVETHNSTHWKRMINNDREDYIKSFRRFVNDKLGMTEDEYLECWNSMVEFRNKYIVHREDYTLTVPYFDFAENVVESFDLWVREKIKPDILDYPTIDNSLEDYRDAISQTLMGIITKRQFMEESKIKCNVIKKELITQYNDWKKVITKQEKREIKKYLKSFLNIQHKKLNGALRNNTGEYSKQIHTISTALKKARINNNIILFRDGNLDILKDNELEKLPIHDLIGKEIIEKGFMSTTKWKHMPCKGDIRYIIEVPQGVHGVYVAPMNLLIYRWEQEVLFDCGMRMMILDVDTSKKRYKRFYVKMLCDNLIE